MNWLYKQASQAWERGVPGTGPTAAAPLGAPPRPSLLQSSANYVGNAIHHALAAKPAEREAEDDSEEGTFYPALLMPEIIMQVFSFMTPEAVMYAAPVCSAWRDVSRSPMLWKGKVCPRLAAVCGLNEAVSHERTSLTSAATADPKEEVRGDFDGSDTTTATVPVMPGLADLGTALSLPRLWLALYERNFLFNPTFKRPNAMDSLTHTGGWVRGCRLGHDTTCEDG